MSEGPSKGQLALLSIVGFFGMLLLGAAVGLLVGSDDRPDTAITAASVPTSRVEATPVADDVSPTTVSPSTVPPATTVVRSTTVEEAADASVTTTVVEPAEPPGVEVLAVTELGLDLGAATSGTTTAPNAEVEFVELPKAVYDQFNLELGETLVINIAANDKIGGLFDSVRETGLGGLPPGFALEASGVLSGVARECGNWRAQYELISDNPAIGTSWIEITVGGCPSSG